MSKLLHIVGSPRGERSKSREIGDAVAAAFIESDGNSADTLDVWAMEDLPAFDGDALTAKYAVLSGNEFTSGQKAAWEAIEAMANDLKSYDVVVVSTPMWNFNLPYRLKHYIDVITQPGLTFAYDPQSGYSGLATGTKGVAVVSRSNPYEGDMAGLDHQQPYLEQWMGFLGIDRVATIDVSPTVGSPDDVEAAMAAAREKAAEVARSL